MDFESESKYKGNDIENLQNAKGYSFDNNIIRDFENIKREDIVRIIIKLNL